MSMFAPGEHPTAIEIEEAIRRARRERSVMFAELLGTGLAAVKDAVTPGEPGESVLTPVTHGTARPRRA